MSKVVHTSRIRIQKDKGPKRFAFVEGFETPFVFGVHSGIKDFYGLDPEEEHPATLDHMVAAVGGWMTGTLGRALEVRGIPSYPDKLWSDVEGDIEDVDGVMKITEIRVRYHIKLDSDKAEEAERALSVHERACPAAMSVKGAIRVKFEAEFE